MSIPDASRLVADNLTLPTIPVIVQRVQALVDDPDASLREIGALVAEDPPTAAKVMRIANSAFYGLREPCISPEHATAVLGPRVLRNLVMQAAVFGSFEHLKRVGGFDLERIWTHSACVARAADLIARRVKARKRLGLTPEELYACGLVHDLGKVVLVDNLGESYLDVLRRSLEAGAETHLLEREVLGFDHTDVGALIARRWGLPKPVSEAIQHHHAPDEITEQDPALAIVVVANAVAHAAPETDEPPAPGSVLAPGLACCLGLTTADVAEVLDRATVAEALA